MKSQRNHARLHLRLTLALIGSISAGSLLSAPTECVFAQTVYPSWSFTGNLNTGRDYPSTTLLSNGKVLVAGGLGDGNTSLSSAEVYDPASGTWSFTGSLNFGRSHHTATLLPNGKVLVAGGYTNPPTPVDVRSRAELYDPATGTWSNTGNLNFGRHDHTARLLQSGKVMVMGGSFGPNSELYDPATGTWTITGSFSATDPATPTLLPSGKVLIEGGGHCDSEDNCMAFIAHKNAELYDPISGTWSSTGDLNTARLFHTATLLTNGKVLVAGGRNGLAVLSSAELYDPAAGTWSPTGNLNVARDFHTATLLSNGKVLVAGGGNLDSAELYDPATGRWSITAYLNTVRRDGANHPAFLLPGGKVLVAGGGFFSYDRTAELYDAGGSPNSNLIDDAQFFAHEHYSDFLQRSPDASGLAFWTNEIASCGNDQQCIEVKRINVSAAFYLSIEFQETGYFVYRIHKAAQGNLPGAPVPVKSDEFLAETAEVGAGVIVGKLGWEETLESNKQSFLFKYDDAGNKVGDRFTSAYPTSMTPPEFVDTLFGNAEVTPSANDRLLAINEFGSATTTTDVAARARALRRVAENPTLKQQEFNRAFVLMQYFGYLRRNPNDPPEATLDFTGYNFWLNKLNSFNGNFTAAEMVKAFISSSEYRRRFEP